MSRAEVVGTINPKDFRIKDFPLFKGRLKVDLPLGALVTDISRVGHDRETVRGLEEMEQCLAEGPGIAFDAHRLKSGVDIVSSGAQVLQHLPITDVYAPIAASFFYADTGVFPYVARAIEENPGVHPMVVYRRETKDRTVAEQGSISSEKMHSHNSDFLSEIDAFAQRNQPYSLLFIAPYGSRKAFEQEKKIRLGAIKAARTGIPILFTLTHFAPLLGRPRMHTSERVVRCNPNMSDGEIREIIQSNFGELKRRVLKSER